MNIWGTYLELGIVKLPPSIFDPIKRVVDTGFPFPKDMFDGAKDHVYELLLQDPYPTYVSNMAYSIIYRLL
jgi:hypothetical protein